MQIVDRGHVGACRHHLSMIDLLNSTIWTEVYVQPNRHCQML